MDLGLEGKVVVVTGGASGIGLAAVRAFLAAGAAVTVLDVNQESLARVAGELPEVDTVNADVSSAGDVDAAFEGVVERHGRLDVAVNNAGISRPFCPFHEMDEAVWDAVAGANLKGVWLCMRSELRQMHAQGGGVIVNTGSVASFVGTQGASAYAAAKHGVIGLTRTAALEYAPLGIRVSMVAPGTLGDTAMSEKSTAGTAADPYPDALVRQPHPLRQYAASAEVADAILFMASDRSSFCTGSALVVDGGFLAQ